MREVVLVDFSRNVCSEEFFVKSRAGRFSIRHQQYSVEQYTVLAMAVYFVAGSRSRQPGDACRGNGNAYLQTAGSIIVVHSNIKYSRVDKDYHLHYEYGHSCLTVRVSPRPTPESYQLVSTFNVKAHVV